MACSIFAIIGINVFNALSHLTGAFCVICFCIKYIGARKAGSLGSDKCLFRMGLVYFIFITLAFVMYAMVALVHCTYPSIQSVFKFSGVGFYVLQYFLLILLLFHRLCFIFKGTNLEVSNRVVAGFYASYALMIFLILLVPANVAVFHLNLLIFDIPIICIAVGLIGFLTASFIKKLRTIVKVTAEKSEHKDEKMLRVAIKSFILTIASFLSLLLFRLINIPIAASSNEDVVLFGFWALLDVDLMTNFLSIALGFNQFNPLYLRLCGFCDEKCIACCTKSVFVTSQNERKLAKDIESVKSVESTQDDTASKQPESTRSAQNI